jgi:undecaprenyl-phosphate 4-deoxy-4-formamido-L-arabinose transferase
MSLFAVGFSMFLLVRRFLVGAEVEGVFTLFAILFVFSGLQMFGLALIGEYVGRIYREVRQRPRFVVREELGGPQV